MYSPFGEKKNHIFILRTLIDGIAPLPEINK
jgi:hypothetical protein